MRLTLFALATLIASTNAFIASITRHAESAECTLTASGSDDAPQFLNAVQTCDTVVIPASETLEIQTRLNMTGLSNKNFNLQGTIRFKPDIDYWSGNAFFIPFQTQVTFWLLGGENIVMNGGGTLDGAGQAWYDAFVSNSTLLRPITMTIFQAENVLIENIRMINSPEWHNLVNEGKNVVYSNITIHAESTSDNNPANTDGWNVYRSDNVIIKDSNIVNGDDCVAFKPNATNVVVSNLTCSGSQSLGQFAGMFDIVRNVSVVNIRMSNAKNGARIKAWAGRNVGSGIVQNVTFKDFIVDNVDNPIVIDQCYETDPDVCAEFPSNTFIQDIFFKNISGRASGSTVADLACSPDGRCSDINVNDLELSAGSGTATFECQNVELEGNSANLFPECTETGSN
ncbi:pectin lyase-like protein [Dendrothele bispora CBS 962.96]|uniref:galacturonan 1,4-alpha-galacturonidase n=1 Tax=Dendrothele bispora (strain CBS 962.96) TaxID=1314807 RepID=A0A4S8LPX0_DENBC|nr:pectin lyase-like protein [Dendrothele bispora CBS 962.96]